VTHRTHRRAFTLVEMLVVVAIISILTAITVPTLNRIGVFGRDPLNVASRQVLTMLKAARIYAGTHNVDTAVVYAVKLVPDNASPSNANIHVIDGCAIVRRLKPEEFPNLNPAQIDMLRGSERPQLMAFVPIRNRGNVFEMLQRGAVVGAYNPDFHKPPVNSDEPLLDFNDWREDAGICAIRVLDPDNGFADLEPRTGMAYQITGWPATAVFPAHVFKPSGVLQDPGSDKSRFELAVIPMPNADEDERFYTDPNGGVKRLVPAERIEIFGTIGRIQSIDREPVT